MYTKRLILLFIFSFMKNIRRNVQYTFTYYVYYTFHIFAPSSQMQLTLEKNHHRLIRVTDFYWMNTLFFVYTRSDNIFTIAYVLTRAKRTIIRPSITPHVDCNTLPYVFVCYRLKRCAIE